MNLFPVVYKIIHCIIISKVLFFFLICKGSFLKVFAGDVCDPSRHTALCKRCLLCPSSPGLTAAAAAAANAAIAEAMKVKKIKLEAMSSYHSNANHHGADGENGDLSSSVGERAYSHTNTLTQIRESLLPTVDKLRTPAAWRKKTSTKLSDVRNVCV